MDKQELITKLTELGYQVKIIDGLPYIINMPYADADKVVSQLCYNGSYGIKNQENEV